MASDAGRTFKSRISLLVSASPAPSTGSMAGSEPVAMIIRSADIRRSPTSTSLGPVKRASPRITSTSARLTSTPWRSWSTILFLRSTMACIEGVAANPSESSIPIAAAESMAPAVSAELQKHFGGDAARGSGRCLPPGRVPPVRWPVRAVRPGRRPRSRPVRPDNQIVECLGHGEGAWMV